MARSRQKQREYMRQYRARKRADGATGHRDGATGHRDASPAAVTPLRVAAGTGLDLVARSVQEGVLDELQRLPASTEQPGLAAASLALARVLDDPGATPQHPAAARALGDLLGRLRDVGRPGAGKLDEVRSGVPRLGGVKK